MARSLRRTPPARLAGVVAGVVLVLTGCSDPAPTDVPGPAASTAPAPGASTSSPSPDPSPSTSPGRTATSAPPGTTAPPQPSAAGDGSVEPRRPVVTAAPKRLDEPTRTAGARVSLVSVRATSVKASGPGDSSGPGVLVRLKMDSTTGKSLDTSFVQVDVDDAAGNPGTFVAGSPTDPIAGTLRAGRSAEGTYAFLLPDARSAPVTVSVYVTSGQPVVTFRGQAS